MWRNLAITMLLSLSACGFHPMHGIDSPSHALITDTLASIALVSIDTNANAVNYHMRHALEERLRTGYAGTEPRYRLELKNDGTDQLLTGAPSLTSLTLTTHYQLYDIKTGESLLKDTASYAGYLIQDADPLTITLSREQEVNYMLDEIAEKIAYRLECYFLQRENNTNLQSI